MKSDNIINAFKALIKSENESSEDVFYNAGIIDAIKEIEKLIGKAENTNKKG